jgi:hypothetical protein
MGVAVVLWMASVSSRGASSSSPTIYTPPPGKATPAMSKSERYPPGLRGPSKTRFSMRNAAVAGPETRRRRRPRPTKTG